VLNQSNILKIIINGRQNGEIIRFLSLRNYKSIPAMMHANYTKFCPMVVLILDFRSTKNNITDVMVFQ
jgi:hypothetical protein